MGKPYRTYTPEFKVRAVMELMSGKKSQSEASREYGIIDTAIARRRHELMERKPQIFKQPGSKHIQAERIALVFGLCLRRKLNELAQVR